MDGEELGRRESVAAKLNNKGVCGKWISQQEGYIRTLTCSSHSTQLKKFDEPEKEKKFTVTQAMPFTLHYRTITDLQ